MAAGSSSSSPRMDAKRGRQAQESATAGREGADELRSPSPAPSTAQTFETPQPAGQGDERGVGPAMAKRRRLLFPVAASQHESSCCNGSARSPPPSSLLRDPLASFLQEISAPGADGNSSVQADSGEIGSASTKRDSTPAGSSERTTSTLSPCNSICNGFFSPQRSPKIGPSFPACLASRALPMLPRASPSLQARAAALQDERDELHQALKAAVASGRVMLL